MMSISRRRFIAGVSLTAISLGLPTVPLRAWPVHGSSSGGFNNKPVQINLTNIQVGGDYPFLNFLKASQGWILQGSATGLSAALDPTMLDDNGYWNNSTAAPNGVYTTFNFPSQQERPGAYVLKWPGNGSVGTFVTNATAFALGFTTVSQSGGIQTFTMASSPQPWFRAGYPISISGLSGGSWGGLNGNWTIASVTSTSLSINTGTTFTGSPTITSGTATFVTTTTVQNDSGLNGSGRYVFMPENDGPRGAGAQQGYIGVNSLNTTTDYPGCSGDIVFCHIDDEALVDAGKIFSQKFISTYSNAGVLRNLGWAGSLSNGANEALITTWSSRKPLSYYAWGAAQYRADLYCGATSNSSTTAFAATAPSGWAGLVDKATIQVKWNASQYANITGLASDGAGNTIITVSNTSADTTFANGDQIKIDNVGNGSGSGWTSINNVAYTVASVSGNTFKVPYDSSAATGTPSFGVAYHTAISLDVGGSGAINVLNENCGALDLYSSVGGLQTSLNGLAWSQSFNFSTLVYDATLNAWMKFGGDVAYESFPLTNGVPVELYPALTKATGAHVHFVSPHLACNPLTDFLPQFALYMKANLPSWCIPRYEGPNELWNTATGFFQTPFAIAQSAAMGYPTNFDDWYGKVMSIIGQALSQIYGVKPGVAANYGVYVGIQSTLARQVGSIAVQRVESTAFVAAGVAPPSLTIPGFGTLTFQAVAAAAAGAATANNYVSHVCLAQYWNPNYQGTTEETTLATNWAGCTIADGQISDGVFTVNQVQNGTVIFDGTMSIWGDGLPIPGITITGQLSGTPGGVGTYSLSDSTFNPGFRQAYYGGVDFTTGDTYVESAKDWYGTGSINGSALTLSATTSGDEPSAGSGSLFVSGGSIPYGTYNNCIISGGSYPNYTLDGSPGNQVDVSLRIGNFSSLDGCSNLYQNAAAYANNHGIKKVAGYEGCYSPDYSGQFAADSLKAFSRWSHYITSYTKENYDNFFNAAINAGLSGMTMEFPSLFLATGIYPTGGVWQTLEDIYANPQPPQWTETVAYPN